MKNRNILIATVGIVAIAIVMMYSKANGQTASGSSGEAATTSGSSGMMATNSGSTAGATSGVGSGTSANGSFTTTGSSNGTTNANGNFTTDSTTNGVGTTRPSSFADTTDTFAGSNGGVGVGMNDNSNPGSTSGLNSSSSRFNGGRVGVMTSTASQRLPANSSLITEGEVVGINQGGKTISVRKSAGEPVTTYSISDGNMLQELSIGDSVSVFSQADKSAQ